MESKPSIEDLMFAKPDPKEEDKRRRFNNAQIATDLAYKKLADKHSYVPDKKVANPDWKEGEDKWSSKWDYVDATSDERASELVRVARILKAEIEKDLNDTLKILE